MQVFITSMKITTICPTCKQHLPKAAVKAELKAHMDAQLQHISDIIYAATPTQLRNKKFKLKLRAEANCYKQMCKQLKSL